MRVGRAVRPEPPVNDDLGRSIRWSGTDSLPGSDNRLSEISYQQSFERNLVPQFALALGVVIRSRMAA